MTSFLEPIPRQPCSKHRRLLHVEVAVFARLVRSGRLAAAPLEGAAALDHIGLERPAPTPSCSLEVDLVTADRDLVPPISVP